jgi:hypothetical protein
MSEEKEEKVIIENGFHDLVTKCYFRACYVIALKDCIRCRFRYDCFKDLDLDKAKVISLTLQGLKKTLTERALEKYR